MISAKAVVAAATRFAGLIVACRSQDARAASTDAVGETVVIVGKPVVIARIRPQGEVADVCRACGVRCVDGRLRQRAVSPSFDVQCPATGAGRRINGRTWARDFSEDVGPVTRCGFTLEAHTKSRDGRSVARKAAFTFPIGGPPIVRHLPSAGKGGPGIDEEQVLKLFLNGPATPARVIANAWCEVSPIAPIAPIEVAP